MAEEFFLGILQYLVTCGSHAGVFHRNTSRVPCRNPPGPIVKIPLEVSSANLPEISSGILQEFLLGILQKFPESLKELLKDFPKKNYKRRHPR